MIVLPTQNFKKEDLLRIIKKNDNLWQIEIGPWYENGKPWTDTQNFLTKEKIIMSKDDLFSLIEEIKMILRENISKETKLNLSFRENLPQLEISVCVIDHDYPLFSEDLLGMVQFTPSINIKYLIRGYGREEDQYLYENGGRHEGMVQYYSIEEITKFINDIEKEIA
ncbi:MAG TPA: hypothetical protein DEB09_00960 [Candidatus Magasanikbacteria bacterium]|nr:hypothetical protein [Candidatus Magasanikbacteria bacterium]